MIQIFSHLGKTTRREYIKKYRFVFMFLILFMAVLLAQLVQPVNAVTPGNNEMIRSEIDNVLNGLFVVNVKYMKEAYLQFVNLTKPTGAGATALNTIAKSLSNVVMVFAVFLCMIFSMIGVVKESMRGEITMDYWTKIFISSVVAIFLVFNVGTLLNSLYNAGGALIDSVESAVVKATENGVTEDETTISEEEKRKLLHLLSKCPPFNGYVETAGTGTDGEESEEGEETGGTGGGTGEEGEDQGQVTVGTIEDIYYGTTDAYYASQYLHELMTPMQLLSLLPMLASMYLMYIMIFEIKLREIFAPIMVAGIGYEGARSTGIRALKKYLACYVRIALYFAIASMGYMMTRHFYARTLQLAVELEGSKTLTVAAVSSIILMFGANALAALAMMQSGSLADEIVGA